ncbi:MAG TPA: thioredoxin domain-containing protein [Pyrinomonadaceae bacterium]|nr:thioredoxin domain-containing protein [Pyrinomonadaceae bacterium]
MKRHLTLIIVLVGLIGGTAAGLWLARRGTVARQPAPVPLRELSAASEGAQPPHARGSEGAQVTLEEFGDFQCPPCARLHALLKEIEKDYGARVRFVYRHFPLDSHEHARGAALAAEAAALQGKFWEMHDLLYERQGEWEAAQDAAPLFTGYAQSLGLDVERFRRDVNAEHVRARVSADERRGDSVNISATPTLFLNGRELPPEAMTPEGVRAAVETALRPTGRAGN